MEYSQASLKSSRTNCVAGRAWNIVALHYVKGCDFRIDTDAFFRGFSFYKAFVLEFLNSIVKTPLFIEE